MERGRTRFTNAEHTIFWDDALEVLDTSIDDSAIDLIFADPPYNIGKQFHALPDRWPSDAVYLEWCYRWLDLCIAKLKPNGSMYLMNTTQNMPHLDLYLRDRLTIRSRIVWHYDSSSVQARRHFGSCYEPILYGVKNPHCYTFNGADIQVPTRTGALRKLIDYRKTTPAPYRATKVPGNVWEFPRIRYRMAEYEQHPTQKPEALLERIIRASSNVGDLVLDPFAGTFTTCAVARKLGRRSIGIELQEEYVKIGLRRVGIQVEYNGVPLVPPRKTFRRRAPRRASLERES